MLVNQIRSGKLVCFDMVNKKEIDAPVRFKPAVILKWSVGGSGLSVEMTGEEFRSGSQPLA